MNKSQRLIFVVLSGLSLQACVVIREPSPAWPRYQRTVFETTQQASAVPSPAMGADPAASATAAQAAAPTQEKLPFFAETLKLLLLACATSGNCWH